MIEEQGDSIVDDFEIGQWDDGSWEYTVSGFTLNRFKADLFGQAQISDLKKEQLEISAEDLMTTLCDKDHYGLIDPKITDVERKEYDLPESYT